MNIPESQCDFLIKEAGKPQFVHCVKERGHFDPHNSPLLNGKSHSGKSTETEGTWFQAVEQPAV